MSNVVCLPYTNPMTHKDYNVSLDLDKRFFIRFNDNDIITIDNVQLDARAATAINEKLKTLNWIKGYYVSNVTNAHIDSYMNPAFVLDNPMYFTLDGLSVEINSSIFEGDSLAKIKAMISN